jgi:undecaprenyl diphosphate synthase
MMLCSETCSPPLNRKLKKEAIPRHVAIIMDGNRRWGKKNKFNGCKDILSGGHWAGAEALLPIVRTSKDLGIEVLTVWGLSTENFSRPQSELDVLFHIYEVYLRKNRAEMVASGVKFKTIGQLNSLPKSVIKEIEITKEATKECHDITLVVALNYGGRDDLKRACQKIVDDCLKKHLLKEEITEELISDYLDTAPYHDPDLLIRTSGEMRVSNFLLWQLAYSEIYITETLWPDFKPADLQQAVLHYQNRERRRGK